MRWLIFGALVGVALAFVGVRVLSRLSTVHDVQEATGIRWPADSTDVTVSSDTGLKASHATVTVTLSSEGRDALLASLPTLARGECLSGARVFSGASQNWQVCFDKTTGQLTERLDAFY